MFSGKTNRLEELMGLRGEPRWRALMEVLRDMLGAPGQSIDHHGQVTTDLYNPTGVRDKAAVKIPSGSDVLVEGRNLGTYKYAYTYDDYQTADSYPYAWQKRTNKVTQQVEYWVRARESDKHGTPRGPKVDVRLALTDKTDLIPAIRESEVIPYYFDEDQIRVSPTACISSSSFTVDVVVCNPYSSTNDYLCFPQKRITLVWPNKVEDLDPTCVYLDPI